MGLTTKELEDLAASSSRFYIIHSHADEYMPECWACIDRTTGVAVGNDGGEPEDQLLVRDWYWVVQALNRLDQEWQEKVGFLKGMERRCEAEHEPAYEYLPAPWATTGDKTLADCVKEMAEEVVRLRVELQETLEENSALSEARANDNADIDMPKVIRILDETRNKLATSNAEGVGLKQLIVDLTGEVFELEARLAGNSLEEAEMVSDVVKESLVKDTILDPSKQP